MYTPDSLIAQATKLLNQGKYDQAYNHAIKYLNFSDEGKGSRNIIPALTVAASALMLANKPSEAIKLFLKIKTLSPEKGEISAYLARCYLAATKMPEARQAALKALSDKNLNAQGLTTAGVVLSHCHDHNNALNAFVRAQKKTPGNPELLFNLACAYKFTGDFKAAESHYERALALKPDYGQAMAGLAEIPNKSQLTARIKRLEGMSAQKHIDEFRYYSLAREYERQHLYEKAFQAFSYSASIRKNRSNYSSNQDKEIFSAIRSTFDEDFVKNIQQSDSESTPIFIVGMPRTGTTLVERILSNHSTVQAFGELRYLPAVVKRNSRSQSTNAINPDVFLRSRNLDFSLVAQDYETCVTAVHTAKSPKFTDKLPMNYFYIGIILKAFPKAKIVILRRNPLDTCLSNFRQLFGADSVHQYHSNSIEDVAHYYVEFDRLINHWRSLFSNSIHEIHYEQLVRAPEQTLRKLLDYCDLDWQTSCLEFHKNPQPLATASAYQARQPIYNDAAGRAAKYGNLLQPAIDILQANGIQL